MDKVLWWGKRLVFGVFMFFLLVYLLLQIPFFQTWAAQRVTNFLSKEMHTTVQIERLSIAFFDELVRSEQVDIMVEQDAGSRANSLRQSRFIPAVEYLQANRHRRVLIEQMHELMQDVDVLISPTFGNRQLLITNLTGHPVVAVSTGLDEENHPTSMTLVGNLYDEGKIITLARAFQERTTFDELHPPDFVAKP